MCGDAPSFRNATRRSISSIRTPEAPRISEFALSNIAARTSASGRRGPCGGLMLPQRNLLHVDQLLSRHMHVCHATKESGDAVDFLAAHNRARDHFPRAAHPRQNRRIITDGNLCAPRATVSISASLRLALSSVTIISRPSPVVRVMQRTCCNKIHGPLSNNNPAGSSRGSNLGGRI